MENNLIKGMPAVKGGSMKMEQTDKAPVQIAFLGLDYSEATAERIRERADKLMRFCDKITGIRVTVELVRKTPNPHTARGDIFQVSIEVRVPGQPLVVNHSLKDPHTHSHDDIGPAIRDSFATMERLVREYVERHNEQR